MQLALARLRGQLDRAPEAVAGRSVGQRDSLSECRAAQSRQARPEEAQEPSWGTAKGGTLTMLLSRGVTMRAPARTL